MPLLLSYNTEIFRPFIFVSPPQSLSSSTFVNKYLLDALNLSILMVYVVLVDVDSTYCKINFVYLEKKIKTNKRNNNPHY